MILNYGDVFFGSGDRLAAFSVGESFLDPDTGEVLGAEKTEIHVIEITRAEQRFPVQGSSAAPSAKGRL